MNILDRDLIRQNLDGGFKVIVREHNDLKEMIAYNYALVDTGSLMTLNRDHIMCYWEEGSTKVYERREAFSVGSLTFVSVY